jgi:hypothetical protein
MSLSQIDHHANKNPVETDKIQNLTEEAGIRSLLEKTEEVLSFGGLHAEALTILILDFHGCLSEEIRL